MNILHKIFNHGQKSRSPQSLAWMTDLCKKDDISTIEFATLKIAYDFKNSLFQNIQNIETLFSTDEEMHSIVERITQHFIHIENTNQEFKARISNTAFSYHRQLFLIYSELSEYSKQSDLRTLHIMLARALRNAIQMIKWQHYNDRDLPAKFWHQISNLFKTAEKSSLLTAKIQSYSGQDPISLSSAFIQVCMLGTLKNTHLKPQQIEFTSQLLTAWTSKISVDSSYNAEQHLFYINTVNNKAAQRIRNFNPTEACRYWRLDDVMSKIDQCIQCIEYNIPPSQPQMKALLSNQCALETLEILRNEWSYDDYRRQ